MIIWNFDTPITFFASCIWNFAEYFGFSLGKFLPYIFGLVVNRKSKKVDFNSNKTEE